ncbi:hypothetical protein BMS3Abin17_00917 [archaeon BMS3Abin17]|nr:hypothetical protein BMS3Abin17_00917 [archaeon BMS3Abin17]HDZ61400.1 hypothetical protein [Candidatus Pacearchaeota archaeon]
MNKEGKNYVVGEIELLSQLVNSLEESALKLEDFYEEEDYEKFNNTKKFILQIQRKIDSMIK